MKYLVLILLSVGLVEANEVSLKIINEHPWIVNPRPVSREKCVNIQEIYNKEIISKFIARNCKHVANQPKWNRHHFECNSDYVNKFDEDTYFYKDKATCKKRLKHEYSI